MKQLFDDFSFQSSRMVTRQYSTSFSLAVKMLSPSIRDAIYSIYGFVRFADEIVDSFHGYNKRSLLFRFEKDVYTAIDEGVSLNPILNSFQHTVTEYNIGRDLIDAFLKSMKMDLDKYEYNSVAEYKEYIYGSADVVGLMCLKVFVKGDEDQYNKLKGYATRLGSAFQKVNFLRDLKDDTLELGRTYFPNMVSNELNYENKELIVREIEEDFAEAYKGILQLPMTAKFGVYTAYIYYNSLLRKLKKTPVREMFTRRIRVSNPGKLMLLSKSFLAFKLNLL